MTSIKVGCATRSLYASAGPKAEGVPTNNQRGRGSGPCRLWGGLDKARHIVPTALLDRVQRFRNDLYKAVKGPNTRPIVLSMIAGSKLVIRSSSVIGSKVGVMSDNPRQFFWLRRTHLYKYTLYLFWTGSPFQYSCSFSLYSDYEG